ncbi:hypothetical protein D9M73_249890 [compost metagenome]
MVEDIATGSAAGPVAAWMVEQGLEFHGQPFALSQGCFLGRPSRLDVCVDDDNRVKVGGKVQLLAQGRLLAAPADLG